MRAAGPIAYITSQFPVLRETFISREVIELERRGFDVLIAPLRSGPQKVGVRELPKAEVLYKPFLSPSVLGGAAATLARHPAAVLRYIGFISVRLIPRPPRLFKFFGLLPKTLYLIECFRKSGVSHIHSHWATLPTTCALFISLVTKIPLSFSAHAWDIFVSGTEYLLKEKIEHADRVFTCTRFNKSRLSEFGDPDKIEVMYHGIEIDRYPFEQTKRPGTPLILAGGSLIEQKGLSDLVEALAIVREREVSFRAEIFGDGPERGSLESLIDDHRLGEFVKLVGTLPHEDVIGLMRRASVFVMPSKPAARGYTDGLPNVVAEAMASGVCVVATRHSGIPELVEDGADGVLVEPGDVPGLASSIERVLGDFELCHGFRVQARKKVETVFNVRENVKPLADYFERLPADKERQFMKRT